MIVKIGNRIIDSKDETVVLMLDEHEKNIIGNLKEDCFITFSPQGIGYQLPINKEDVNEK